MTGVQTCALPIPNAESWLVSEGRKQEAWGAVERKKTSARGARGGIVRCRRAHRAARGWIMLQEKLAPSHRRRFLNVSTGECIKLDLPELRDHETLGRTSEGLLFLLYKRANIRLLNPLTRHLEELPPLITLLPPDRYTYLISTPHFEQCMTAWGCGITNDSVIVLYLHKLRILAIAKPGDERWTSVSYKSHPSKLFTVSPRIISWC